MLQLYSWHLDCCVFLVAILVVTFSLSCTGCLTFVSHCPGPTQKAPLAERLSWENLQAGETSAAKQFLVDASVKALRLKAMSNEERMELTQDRPTHGHFQLIHTSHPVIQHDDKTVCWVAIKCMHLHAIFPTRPHPQIRSPAIRTVVCICRSFSPTLSWSATLSWTVP